MRIVPDNKVTATGIKASVAKKLSFDDNECCLSSLSPKRVDIKRIGLDLHRVFTYSTEKIGLSAFDTKRWICDDGISTLEKGILYTRLCFELLTKCMRLEQLGIIQARIYMDCYICGKESLYIYIGN